MATKHKLSRKPARSGGKEKLETRRVAVKPNAASRSAERVGVLAIRQSLGLNRQVFSRLSQFSERAIAKWESGQPLSAPSRQRMSEIKRLQQALSRVMKEDFVGEWLQTPNDAFEGLKPLEVIERGQIDRLWRMIYMMESGTVS